MSENGERSDPNRNEEEHRPLLVEDAHGKEASDENAGGGPEETLHVGEGGDGGGADTELQVVFAVLEGIDRV